MALDEQPSRESASVDPAAARRELERLYADCRLLRPLRRAAYDPGDRLEYEVIGVAPARRGRVVAEVERFVGGGFAGQVYRVRLLEVANEEAGRPVRRGAASPASRSAATTRSRS